MLEITKETWRSKNRSNAVEVVEDVVEVIVSRGKKQLNEKHIETQLGHANLPAITLQHSSKLRKQRQELQKPRRRFLKENFAKQIIMDCKTTSTVNFRTRLGFNQHDPIMTQEQSILSKIVTAYAAEEIILLHNVLGYRTDAYFFQV